MRAWHCCLDESPRCIHAASPARGSWPWLQELKQGVAGILSLASQLLEALLFSGHSPCSWVKRREGAEDVHSTLFIYVGP